MAEVKKYTTDRVYEDLFHLLMNGNYAPGDKLPSENELKQRFNVSRNTIRAALNRMNVLASLKPIRGMGPILKDSARIYISIPLFPPYSPTQKT